MTGRGREEAKGQGKRKKHIPCASAATCPRVGAAGSPAKYIIYLLRGTSTFTKKLYMLLDM